MSLSIKNILPILMIAASLWAFFGFLRPKYDVIQGLRAEKVEYQQALDNASEVRVRRGHLLEVYDSFSPAEWNRLQKMLPSDAEGLQLARDISGIAQVFAITLDTVSFIERGGAAGSNPTVSAPNSGTPPDGGLSAPQPSSAALSSKILELSFAFQTTYPNFLRFLRELERSLELSDVRSLSISRAASKVGGNITTDGEEYSFSLKVDTYWVE